MFLELGVQGGHERDRVCGGGCALPRKFGDFFDQAGTVEHRPTDCYSSRHL